jgi:hypothetical protein
MLHTTWRIARAGLAAAVVVAVAGWVTERVRFGASEQAAVARIASGLRERFAASADSLGRIAARVVADRTLIESTSRGQVPAARLFEVVEAALTAEEASQTGITVYDALSTPAAWAGRTSDLFKERINGPPALFVEPGALGPAGPHRAGRRSQSGPAGHGRRRAAVRVVNNAPPGLTLTLTDTSFCLASRPVGDVAPQGATFVITRPGAGPLVDASPPAARRGSSALARRHVDGGAVGRRDRCCVRPRSHAWCATRTLVAAAGLVVAVGLRARLYPLCRRCPTAGPCLST